MFDLNVDPPPAKNEAETFEELERQIKRGLGPEAALVDTLKDGVVMEAFVASQGGRLLIRDCLRRIAAQLESMTAEPHRLTPERAFQEVLALTYHIGLLRRVAATIKAGLLAEEAIKANAQEREAHGHNLPE